MGLPVAVKMLRLGEIVHTNLAFFRYIFEIFICPLYRVIVSTGCHLDYFSKCGIEAFSILLGFEILQNSFFWSYLRYPEAKVINICMILFSQTVRTIVVVNNNTLVTGNLSLMDLPNVIFY